MLACGEPAVVEQFIAWLWEGSPASKVTGVETRRCGRGRRSAKDRASLQRLTVDRRPRSSAPFQRDHCAITLSEYSRLPLLPL